MRTRILAAAVAAVALAPLSVLAASPASAAAGHDVLTTGKVGGPNVAVKNVLTAKGSATFAAGVATLKCKTSTFTVKVVKNPTAKGTAVESLTGQTFSKCTATGQFAPLLSKLHVSLTKGTYKVTVGDGKGNPVAVTKPSATVNVTVKGFGALTCVYVSKAKTVNGNASNKHQTVTFKNQTLVLNKKASSATCTALPSATFSAVYGPVVDNSVKGKPHVYVN